MKLTLDEREEFYRYLNTTARITEIMTNGYNHVGSTVYPDATHNAIMELDGIYVEIYDTMANDFYHENDETNRLLMLHARSCRDALLAYKLSSEHFGLN